MCGFKQKVVVYPITLVNVLCIPFLKVSLLLVFCLSNVRLQRMRVTVVNSTRRRPWARLASVVVLVPAMSTDDHLSGALRQTEYAVDGSVTWTS